MISISLKHKKFIFLMGIILLFAVLINGWMTGDINQSIPQNALAPVVTKATTEAIKPSAVVIINTPSVENLPNQNSNSNEKIIETPDEPVYEQPMTDVILIQ